MSHTPEIIDTFFVTQRLQITEHSINIGHRITFSGTSILEQKNTWNASYKEALEIQYGPVLRRGYVLEHLVVNRIVLKRVLFKLFKLR